jgi:choline dehydrogenase-like flavoprotein
MKFISRKELNDKYDFIFIGSGFGALFYLAGMLPRIGPEQSILIIERGGYLSHQEQLERRENSTVTVSDTIEVPRGHKPWNFTIGFGGGTNCWWAQTPRILPADLTAVRRPPA